MALLVAIEGADGAGKGTATGEVRALFQAAAIRSEVISFPRYTATVGGHSLGQFLSGRMPHDVTPQAASVLYALDRLESLGFVAEKALENEIIIFDRYIASNIAYQSAKVRDAERIKLMQWIEELEVGQFRIPRPDLCIYLNTPVEISKELMMRKAKRSYTEKTLDEHERDHQLQLEVRSNYAWMVKHRVLSPWAEVRTVNAAGLRHPTDIAQEIKSLIEGRIRLAA